jgi:hypothetical protein
VKEKAFLGRLADDENSSNSLRKAFNSLAAGKDITVMESCHKILSTSYVDCTQKFDFINLLPGSMRGWTSRVLMETRKDLSVQ